MSGSQISTSNTKAIQIQAVTAANWWHKTIFQCTFIRVFCLLYAAHSISYCYPIPTTLLMHFQSISCPSQSTFCPLPLPLVALGWYLHSGFFYNLNPYLLRSLCLNKHFFIFTLSKLPGKKNSNNRKSLHENSQTLKPKTQTLPAEHCRRLISLKR